MMIANIFRLANVKCTLGQYFKYHAQRKVAFKGQVLLNQFSRIVTISLVMNGVMIFAQWALSFDKKIVRTFLWIAKILNCFLHFFSIGKKNFFNSRISFKTSSFLSSKTSAIYDFQGSFIKRKVPCSECELLLMFWLH